jgi:hypothetical protein
MKPDWSTYEVTQDALDFLLRHLLHRRADGLLGRMFEGRAFGSQRLLPSCHRQRLSLSRWFGLVRPNGRPHYYRAGRGGNMLRAYSDTFRGPLELLVWLDARDVTVKTLQDRLRALDFEKSLFGPRSSRCC